MSHPTGAEPERQGGALESEITTLTPAEDDLLRDALWDACLANVAICKSARKRNEEQLADAAQRRAGALRGLIRKLYPSTPGVN